jgi:hypothetical protein
MITEIFIGIGALFVLWWTLPFILVFSVLAIAEVFFAVWLLIEWAMDWRIFNKKWWKNVFN